MFSELNKCYSFLSRVIGILNINSINGLIPTFLLLYSVSITYRTKRYDEITIPK